MIVQRYAVGVCESLKVYVLCLCVIVQFGSTSYDCSKVRDRVVLKDMCCFSCVMVM